MFKFLKSTKALALVVVLTGFSFRPAIAFDADAEAGPADYQDATGDAYLNPDFQTENLSSEESTESDVNMEINYRQAVRLTRLLYRAILFRAPDAGGLAFYAARIQATGFQGLRSTAFEIAESNEFNNNVMNQYSAQQIVRHAFRVFFFRNPTFRELNFYAFLIRRGDSGIAFRRLVSTREFRRLHLQGVQ